MYIYSIYMCMYVYTYIYIYIYIYPRSSCASSRRPSGRPPARFSGGGPSGI